ncbi:hypothetical protein HA50_20870 [Pantoea cypripedii]|uniref:Uncharacterized protein n=1 Tax=Pantoea cypripedii TaxID=55209 RepID=A0A1X1EJV3_PANCY|nr:hypothetical protein HA50_20870 [Pantoea cypripedii]
MKKAKYQQSEGTAFRPGSVHILQMYPLSRIRGDELCGNIKAAKPFAGTALFAIANMFVALPRDRHCLGPAISRPQEMTGPFDDIAAFLCMKNIAIKIVEG